ncbi:Smr/MutS family protein [Pontimicrobium sp. SW4]|uniref:Smr/MutS family protein n=1 Tax=Pontimicrobium sp. SW4 TaxID=3153519 RepID=A0AAU7BNX7_9FLAO
MFKVGDEVEVLDEAIVGRVVKINNENAIISTSEGFELEFLVNELVLRQSDSLKSKLFSKTSFSEAVSQKETKKRKTQKVKSKERFQPTMEVDLHIHQLTNSTKGMSSHDILTLQLNTAKRQLEFAMSKRIQKIVFIHGVGEGVLKLELEYLFKHYDNMKFYDANYQKYGLGATEVYIYQN